MKRVSHGDKGYTVEKQFYSGKRNDDVHGGHAIVNKYKLLIGQQIEDFCRRNSVWCKFLERISCIVIQNHSPYSVWLLHSRDTSQSKYGNYLQKYQISRKPRYSNIKSLYFFVSPLQDSSIHVRGVSTELCSHPVLGTYWRRTVSGTRLIKLA